MTLYSRTTDVPLVQLSDAVEFLDHIRRPVTEEERIAGPYPYFGANGQQGWIHQYLFDEPLVLLAEDGGHFENPERGIAYCISGKTWVNNHAHVLRPRDGVDLSYLCRVLENADVRRHVTGTTRAKLTKAGASKISIPLPSLQDQRQIAEALDRADVLRTKQRKVLAQLNALTHSIFLDMFGDLTTEGKTDHSMRLGELLKFVTSGSRGWAEYYVPSGARFVRSLDVQMNYIASDSAVFVDPPSSAEARRTRIQEGDVLLTITGSRIGRVAAAPKDLAGAYISQHVAILRLDQRQVVPEFVAYFLSMETGGQRQIAKAQYGQTKPGLNLDQIRNLHVPLPSVADQQEFKKRLNAVRSVITLQTNALAKLDALFFSLQHRALRGEL